jgi:hypothetical protein
MNTGIVKTLSVELCRGNPETIFVFGDNSLRKGCAGQAIIRGEPNAFGVATKILPSMGRPAFMRDVPKDREILLKDLRDLYRISKSHPILFPEQGLGTGLAMLSETAPYLFQEMNEIIVSTFEVEEYSQFLSKHPELLKKSE